MSPITPKSPSDLLRELHNLPFSVPIGEGSFQGLKCSKHGIERFACKDHVGDWLNEAFASLLVFAANEAKPGMQDFFDNDHVMCRESFLKASDGYYSALLSLAESLRQKGDMSKKD